MRDYKKMTIFELMDAITELVMGHREDEDCNYVEVVEEIAVIMEEVNGRRAKK